MNAAALKHGWVLGGNAGAREWLDTFWLRVSGLDGVFGEAIMDWLRAVSPSPASPPASSKPAPRSSPPRR